MKHHMHQVNRGQAQMMSKLRSGYPDNNTQQHHVPMFVRLGKCESYHSRPALIAGDPETLGKFCHRTSHLKVKCNRSTVADFQKIHPVKSYSI